MKNFFTRIDITYPRHNQSNYFMARNKNDGEVVFCGSEEPSCYEKQKFIYFFRKTKKITDVVFSQLINFVMIKKLI